MSESWIKVRDDLHEDTNVLRLSDICRTEVEHAVGLVVRFWSWAGKQTPDGQHLRITAMRLDRLVNREGFTAAMLEIGWLAGEEGDYHIPNFARHNGDCAKARAMEAEAKRLRREVDKVRQSSDKVSDKCRTTGAPNVGPDKRRGEEIRGEERERDKGAREGGVLPLSIRDQIDACLNAYPKDMGREDARVILGDLHDAGVDLIDVLARTQAIAAVVATRSAADRLRIPAMHTFFGGKRYLDDPETWRSARTVERQGAHATTATNGGWSELPTFVGKPQPTTTEG